MRTLTAAIMLTLWVMTPLAGAQARPNFSGTWKCDVTRSWNCGQATVIIEHRGDLLTIRRDEPDAVVQTIRLDGTETVNEPMQKFGFTGRELPRSSAAGRWEGATLAIETRTIDDAPVVRKEVWTLNPDGRELIIGATRSLARNEATTTVYTKVER